MADNLAPTEELSIEPTVPIHPQYILSNKEQLRKAWLAKFWGLHLENDGDRDSSCSACDLDLEAADFSSSSEDDSFASGCTIIHNKVLEQGTPQDSSCLPLEVAETSDDHDPAEKAAIPPQPVKRSSKDEAPKITIALSETGTDHNRLMCMDTQCHWIYHSRYLRQGCLRTTPPGSSKCGGRLVDPTTLTHITFPLAPEIPPTQCAPPSEDHPHSEPATSFLDMALEAVVNQSLAHHHAQYEPECVETLFNAIMTTHVPTVKYVPRCRPLLGEVLSKELRNANHNTIWGAARLMLLAKCTLRHPSKGGRPCHSLPHQGPP